MFIYLFFVKLLFDIRKIIIIYNSDNCKVANKRANIDSKFNYFIQDT